MADFEIVGDSSDRSAWLKARRDGIGGSDSPAILGLVGWASPASVQADKWGLSDEADDAEILRWGRRLEPAIIEGLAEESGVEIEPYGYLLRSTRWPFMLCTPDAANENRTVWAQVKNTTQADDWAEEVPKRVWVQCQHEMAVTGATEMLAAALIFGNRCHWAWVQRDDSFIETALVPALEEFWKATQEHEPVIDGSEHTRKVLQALYPDDTGEEITLGGEFLDLDAERLDLLAEKKRVTARLDEIDNAFRAEMRDATVGVLSNGASYTLKTTHRKGYEVKPSSYRALRRRKGNE